MSLKKKIFSLITFLSLTLVFTMPVFASNADDLAAALKAIGVPNSQTGNILEYLQKVNITDQNYNDLLTKIDETTVLLNGSTDITSLDATTEAKVEKNIADASSILGLTASFSNNANGNVTLNLKDGSNTTIVSMDSQGADSFLTSFEPNKVKSVIAVSEQVSKSTFQPTSGTMVQTGTNYGNYFALGVILILISCLWIVASVNNKKSKNAKA